MFTWYSTSLNIKNLYVLLHTVYLHVLYGSEKQTAIISLHNINWLVFVTETECVYCAVRTESFKYEGWNFNSGNYLFTTDTK